MQKVIFIYWAQKFINAPIVVKKCLLSWKLKNPTWEIIELNDDNLSEYINIEEEIPDIQKKNITSDIIRIFLLAKHGGCWCDATTFCNKPLNNWLNKSISTGFFAFDKPGKDRLLSSWFLYSEENNYIIQKWKEKTILYWKNHNKMHHDFWFHYLFGDLYNSDNKFKELWDNTSKISADGPHYIQHQGLLNKLSDKVKNHINEIKTPLYKLSYEYDMKKYNQGSNLSYLFNKVYTSDNGKFAVNNLTLVTDVSSLLTINRMDIIVNLIYCKFYDKKYKSTFARDLYLNQKKSEKGNKLIEHEVNIQNKSVSHKNGEKEWIEQFNGLIDSIKNNTFIWHDNIREVDMISIEKKSSQLVRGAHRVATHYYFNKDIYAAYTNESRHIHNCKIKNYDFIFNEFIELKKNTLVYVLFPKYDNTKNDEFIKKSINNDKYMNLLYSKKIKLTEKGFIYFLIVLYQIHDICGIGNIDFNVIRTKLLKCYDYKDITIYFIEKKCDRQHIVNFKKNIIRKYIDNKNNHYSFHVSDNHEETRNIARFVLNNNNIFFANHNNIDKFNINYPSLNEIKNTNINKKINVNKIIKDIYIKSNDYCIVGSKILALFGIRQNKDIDIISHNLINGNFDSHNKSFLNFLNLEPDEVIYNPINHMYFFNVKCITPHLYLKFKIARFNKTKDNKDKLDIDNLKLLLMKKD